MNIRPVDHKLYRGSHPTDIPDLRVLADLDVLTIVSLETFWHKIFGWDGEEKWWSHQVLGFGRFFNFPLSNIFPPTKAQTDEILDEIRRSQGLTERSAVYVHCYAGVDRTGWIVAAYRVRYAGWRIDDAWAEAKREGMHWRYRWWKPFFRKLWE